MTQPLSTRAHQLIKVIESAWKAKKITILVPRDFKWKCQRCGECCASFLVPAPSIVGPYSPLLDVIPRYLPTNQVTMTIHEVKRIARRLREHPLEIAWPLDVTIDPKTDLIVDVTFTPKPTKLKPRLCRFFDRKTRLCIIHDIKPNICTLFPFVLDPTLSDSEEDVISISLNCRGIGKGSIVDLREVRKLVFVQRRLSKKSMIYWIKRVISGEPLEKFIKEKGRRPTPEDGDILNLRKYI